MKLDVSVLGWKFNKKNISKKKTLFDCYYCGLNNKKVECSGIFYCPNPSCSGPGAHWFREKLKSYKEFRDERHTVDDKELKESAYMYVYNLIQLKRVGAK
jgi:hypothetical protein